MPNDIAVYLILVAMPPSPLARLRKLCLALPEAHEVEAWGEPTFRVRNKLFAMYAHAENHHGGGRPAVWCKAAPGNQAVMVKAEPGPVLRSALRRTQRLDRDPARQKPRLGRDRRADADAYRLIAPKRLLPPWTP